MNANIMELEYELAPSNSVWARIIRSDGCCVEVWRHPSGLFQVYLDKVPGDEKSNLQEYGVLTGIEPVVAQAIVYELLKVPDGT